jgi:hypothetical protein
MFWAKNKERLYVPTGQLAGEQVGGGVPPSALKEVAHADNKVRASKRRITYFINISSRLREPYFWAEKYLLVA